MTNSGKQYIGPFAYLRINIIVAWHRCRDDDEREVKVLSLRCHHYDDDENGEEKTVVCIEMGG